MPTSAPSISAARSTSRRHDSRCSSSRASRPPISKAKILFDLDLDLGRGRGGGAGRPQRCRQVDHHQGGDGHPGPPRRRAVRYDGQDISRRPAYAIARLGIGYVPEERRVFPQLTILENLEVGRQPTREGAPTWTPGRPLRDLPEPRRAAAPPAGQTSGGEQQMLAIARTLMGNPRLVLLDEPSEGLAPVIVEQMAEAVGRLKQEGLSVLLVRAESALRRGRGGSGLRHRIGPYPLLRPDAAAARGRGSIRRAYLSV